MALTKKDHEETLARVRRKGDPVTVDEVRLGDAPDQGQVVHRDVATFEVTVPGRITGDHLFLSILAEGYRPWNVGLRHNLNRSCVLPLSINLASARYSGTASQEE